MTFKMDSTRQLKNILEIVNISLVWLFLILAFHMKKKRQFSVS